MQKLASNAVTKKLSFFVGSYNFLVLFISNTTSLSAGTCQLIETGYILHLKQQYCNDFENIFASNVEFLRIFH